MKITEKEAHKRMNEEYEICKEACVNHGCYLPPSHEFHRIKANTPMYIRAYYFLKGWMELQKEDSESVHKTHSEESQ